MKPAIERLMDRIVYYPDGCWVWQGWTTDRGYGKIAAGGRGEGTVWVHRVAYEHFVGPVPDGLEIDHVCRTPPCVNPDHMEVVTHQENMRRAYSDKRPRVRDHGQARDAIDREDA